MPFWKRDQPADRPDQVGIDISRILVDEEGVRRPLGEGKFEWVTWDGLTAVLVQTTADGPLSEDLFFVLLGDEENGCVIPQGAMPPGLLERLQLLPGFDNEALISSMSSTDEGRFLVWQRPDAASD